MILTTTPTIEGRNIRQYNGIVCGEVIAGVNFLKDFGASIRNFIGGRSSSYENELIKAREKALAEMSQTSAQVRQETDKKPATTNNERKVLELLSEGTHPLVDLMAVCGYKDKESFRKSVLNPML